MSDVTTYEERYQAAKRAGQVKDTHTVIVAWSEPGTVVMGKLLSMDPLQSSRYPNPVRQYVIDTDRGRVSCLLGGATDRLIEGQLRVGDLVRIEYAGKGILGDGKRANRFHVQVFGHVD